MSLGVGGEVVARLKAIVEVDSSGLTKGLKDAESQSSKTSRALHTGLKAAAVGVAAGFAIATAAVGASIKSAIEYQKAQAKLQTSVKNSGLSWKKYGGQIDDTIKRQAELTGFTEDDLTTAYSKLIVTTKNVAQAQKLATLSMDLARATGKPLTATTLLLQKAYNGSNTALSRLGVTIPKVTTAQDALKNSGKAYTAGQLAAAKASDLRSQREANLAAIQQKFGGQSAAYAKTAAGQWDRFHSTLGIIETEIGLKLIPILSTLLGWLLKVATSKQTAELIDTIKNAIEQLVQAAKPGIAALIQIWGQFAKWYDAHSQQIAAAAGTLARIWKKWAEVELAVVKAVWPVIKALIVTTMHVIGDVVALVLDVLTGKWGKAWGDVKHLVSDSLHGVLSIMGALLGLMGKAAGKIGNAIWDGIVGALKGLGGAVTGLIKGAINGMIDVLNRGLNVISDHWPDVPGAPGPPYGHNPIPRLASGGIIKGGIAGRDSVLALLTPGEMVLNQRQQATLADLLGVAGSGNQPTRGDVHVHQTIVSPTDDQGVHMRSAKFAAQHVFA